MSASLSARIETAIGRRVLSLRPCGSGAAGSVIRAALDDGRTLVCKQGPGLAVEARSLRLLAEQSVLPIPRVQHAEDDLLIMDDLGEPCRIDDRAEAHAADLLAALHGVTSPDGRYGLDFDNRIGPLEQPNAWSPSWVEFFGQRRLLAMAAAAEAEGVLPSTLRRRVEALVARLGDLIPDRPAASLIHGDIWGGNVIARDGRIAGLIDPSPYHGHAEVELAFITMFGTFGRAFFERYAESRPIDPAFERTRRPIYLMYPVLTHIRIYRGGGYTSELAALLERMKM